MRGNRVWAEIDLSAVRNNVSVLRRQLRPDTKLLAVVKADAYGHGAVPFAWTAIEAGAAMLGVGDSAEALELREGGITAPILILGAILEEEIPRIVEYDVAVTVHSPDLLPLLEAEARRQNRLLRIHVKVDTGMGRLGTSPARAAELVHDVLGRTPLELEGLCTHLSSVASGNVAYTREQIDRFQGVVDALQVDGIRPPIVHALNSVGVFTFPEAQYDMVRCGIALYGLDPGIFGRMGVPLQSVLSLRTRVVYLKGLPEGSYVGYDQKYRTDRATRIATCAAGYNDGYPYLLANRSAALVRGRRVPVVGTVTMDYLMLDVGDLPEADVGDEVTLIGRDGTDEIRAEELARRIGTIPYELTCGLGKRVRRVYVATGAAVTYPGVVAKREVA
ncbi:MAG: alanine racemase [Planctomycetes bacterium]|nr:alanine racemase [Planctomycetota bacterium]